MTAAASDAVRQDGTGADRRAVLAELVRTYQRDVDRFDQAVADRLGVHRVDLRCLDVLTDAAGNDGNQWLTPKQLATASGLSPSSITVVLDRLERAGYLRRVRDESNRRQVRLALTESFGQLTREIFAPVAAAGQAHVADYSDTEVAVLIRFFTRSHELRIEQVAQLQAGGTP